jgi:predicted metal-dependent HD superfamily phosphohydrolase
MDRQPGTLDQQRWKELWSRLGAQGSGIPVFDQLASAYAKPERAYHTAQHIRDCLAELDLNPRLAQFPDEVEAALWFHDAVYAPAAADNEEQSAALARSALSSAGVLPERITRIVNLILATKHETAPSTSDEQLICDIDLSILGREPKLFEEFERLIRREYAWVPEPVYRSRRAALLSEFLRRPSIYQSPGFRERFEDRARNNLGRLLAQLAG